MDSVHDKRKGALVKVSKAWIFIKNLSQEKLYSSYACSPQKISFLRILFPYVHKAKTKWAFCQVLDFPFGFLLSIFVDFVGLFNWILVE